MSTQPIRTCVGCRKRTATDELLRVVAAAGDTGLELVPDPQRQAPGRGAHLHPTAECLALAVRRRAFGRALRVSAGLRCERLEAYVQECVSSNDRS